jgi:hypothetical protein
MSDAELRLLLLSARTSAEDRQRVQELYDQQKISMSLMMHPMFVVLLKWLNISDADFKMIRDRYDAAVMQSFNAR